MFTDEERAHFKEMRAITADENGKEILVGLTLEETEYYMRYIRSRHDGTRLPKDRKKFLEIRSKHEHVRLSVIAAEIELRDQRIRPS